MQSLLSSASAYRQSWITYKLHDAIRDMFFKTHTYLLHLFFTETWISIKLNITQWEFCTFSDFYNLLASEIVILKQGEESLFLSA